jgi:hypothetical protein
VETVREEKMPRTEKNIPATNPLISYTKSGNIQITLRFPRTYLSFPSKQRINEEAAQ